MTSRAVRFVSAVVALVCMLAACGGNGENRTGETVDADTVLRDSVAVLDSLVAGPDGVAGVPNGDAADEDEAGEDPANEDPANEDGADEGAAEPSAGGPDDGPAEREEDDPPAPPTPQEREQAQQLLPGRYQLASVEGESLPVTIGEGPECDLQLANGSLNIQESLDFLLRATIHHVCGGELASEDIHSAEGRVLPNGEALRFNARYDSLFAVAYGRRLEDGAILINRLDTEGGPQEVDWRFLR